jgi:hypothetical protein
MLPNLPGRLPVGLTHLVLSAPDHKEPGTRDEGCLSFLCVHLPLLRGLRHLAFHRLDEVGSGLLKDLCTAAKALPQLISLHLARTLLLCPRRA